MHVLHDVHGSRACVEPTVEVNRPAPAAMHTSLWIDPLAPLDQGPALLVSLSIAAARLSDREAARLPSGIESYGSPALTPCIIIIIAKYIRT